MFRALLTGGLNKDHVFACTVGPSSKRTLAAYHLDSPSDVVAALSTLVSSNNQGE